MNKKKYCKKLKNKILKTNILVMSFPLCFIAFFIPSIGVTGGVEVTDEFSLLKGQGVEVCESYLKRLNQTKFEQPPYCDRPEVKGITGFEDLNRVYLTAEEIMKIYDRVLSFNATRNQMFSENVRMKSYLYPDKKRSLQHISSEIALHRLKVWRYRPALDIDNDGEVDNLLMWYTKHESGVCGTAGRFPVPSIRAYVFTKDMSMIDENITREVFEHPDKGWPDIPGAKQFRFIDQVFGVFKYMDAAYFDAFPYKGLVEGQNPNAIDLRVYKHQKEKTNIVCEYHWVGRK